MLMCILPEFFLINKRWKIFTKDWQGCFTATRGSVSPSVILGKIIDDNEGS